METLNLCVQNYPLPLKNMMYSLPKNKIMNDGENKASEVDEESLARKHAMKREMTGIQEMWNAITMIPYPVFFIYMIHVTLSGKPR